MRGAYLVGYLDTSVTPPRYMGCAIYSEPTPTTFGERFTFVILKAEATTYEDAVHELKKARKLWRYDWAKPDPRGVG